MSSLHMLVSRYEFGDSTVGRLYVDGNFFCYTLEDKVRADPKPETPENEAKVFGETAIPTGRYKVILNMSPRFKRIMPRLVGVPGFEGILIHTGNSARDTHGCILVGDKVRDGEIVRGTSTPAYWRLFEKLNKAANIQIEVVNEMAS